MLFTPLFFPILAANVIAQDAFHIPLIKRAPVTPRGIEDYRRIANDLRTKYGYETAPHERKHRSSASFSMINYDSDTSYAVAIGIGTPSQLFNIILDTGSSDLWVPTLQCTTCSSSTPKFNTMKSSTYRTTTTSITLEYVKGGVQGILSQDTVKMGPFSFPQQKFLSVTRTSENLLRGTQSGIMGLGFPSLAVIGAPPFWQNLIGTNSLTAPEMSFWFSRFSHDATAAREEFGGVFTLGGTNSSLYNGAIEFLPFPAYSTPSWWFLELTGVTHSEWEGCADRQGPSSLSAIDTGTTLIAGPSQDVTNMWAAVPGAVRLTGQDQGLFAFPCATKLTVTMAFGGKAWPINTADMNKGPINTAGVLCLGAIFDLTARSSYTPGQDSPRWIVGDTFLKNVYSVFRAEPPSVGFAQLSTLARYSVQQKNMTGLLRQSMV